MLIITTFRKQTGKNFDVLRHANHRLQSGQLSRNKVKHEKRQTHFKKFFEVVALMFPIRNPKGLYMTGVDRVIICLVARF